MENSIHPNGSEMNVDTGRENSCGDGTDANQGNRHETKRNKNRKMWGIVIGYVKSVVLAVMIAFLITSFIKPTIVKGSSMYPSIKPESYLIVNKIPYLLDSPDYGDIIVFSTNLFSEEPEGRYLIKRVIGLGGDTIEIHDGIVYRNGRALTEDYINGGITPGDMSQVKVSADCVFVMGDNRGVSLDSREKALGEIRFEDIVGRVDLRLYPFDEIGVIN